MKKKIIVAGFVMLLSMSVSVLAYTYYESYRVNVSQTKYIDESGACKKVVNSGSSDLFVPTNTAGEWSAFYDYLPTSVTASSVTCCSGAGTDDSACGTISCDDWHHEVGSDSATGTNYCYDSPDITSGRCEGYEDCKDANTADCGSSDDTNELSCGVCKYVNGCTGTTDGYCSNYGAGTDTGTCRECNGAGAEQAPADDSACGTISCDDWHHQVGSDSATGTNYCYDSPNIASSRCEGLGDCKDANTADCGSADDTNELSCGTCKYVNGCSGTTDGYCSNYATSVSCSATQDCDYLNYYHITGTQGATATSYCKYENYADTTRKCDGNGGCSALNCGSPSSSTQATAGPCKYISGCSGGTSGTVSNYADETLCGETSICISGVCKSHPSSYSACTCSTTKGSFAWLCSQSYADLDAVCRSDLGNNYWFGDYTVDSVKIAAAICDCGCPDSEPWGIWGFRGAQGYGHILKGVRVATCPADSGTYFVCGAELWDTLLDCDAAGFPIVCCKE